MDVIIKVDFVAVILSDCSKLYIVSNSGSTISEIFIIRSVLLMVPSITK